jgi:hypothetical protein
VRTGYEIREGSRMIAARIAQARTLRAEDRGPAGTRPLADGERELNGRIRYCEAWRQKR